MSRDLLLETAWAVWDVYDYEHYDTTDDPDGFDMLVESLSKGWFVVSQLDEMLDNELVETFGQEYREKVLIARAFVRALYSTYEKKED